MTSPADAAPSKPQAFRVTLWPKGKAAPEPSALPFRLTFETSEYAGKVCYSERDMLATSANGTRFVVFSGVLYGSSPAGQSILARYEQRGAGCIRDLNGSFALLLVDQAAGDIVLATDRLNSIKLLASEAGGRITASNSMDAYSLKGKTLDPVGSV